MAKALGFAEVGAHVFNELLASHLHAGIKPAEVTFFFVSMARDRYVQTAIKPSLPPPAQLNITLSGVTISINALRWIRCVKQCL